MVRDVMSMTPLEFINTPVTVGEFRARLWNKPLPYRYYDTPDGQDAFKKLWVTGKYGFSISAVWALIDNRMYSVPKTLFGTINRAAYFIVPMTGMWTTYAAVTFVATNLRGKDDSINAAIGGAAAGSIIGFWQKNAKLTNLAVVYCAIGCLFAKYAHMQGHKLFDWDKFSSTYGDHRQTHMDSSLCPIGERGWTTEAS